MSNLFLVPAGDPRARVNFERTVRQPVPLADLDPLGAASRKAARARRAGVRAWGTKPGRDGVNVSTWAAMEPGDWTLFYFDGLFPVAARVVLREHSPAAARNLWGEDGGQTWEHLYLLDEVRQVDVPRLPLNERLGYKPGSYPRGFTRVDRDLDAEFGSVEQLLAELAGAGQQLRIAIEAARAGEGIEAAMALEHFGAELSEEQLRREVDAFDTAAAPRSRRRLVEELERDRRLVEKLKQLYEGKCQLCGFTFEQRNGRPYCEGAHLKPIARREANIDVKDNVFVLCPNHHKMLDYGALRIEWDATGTLVGVIGTEVTPLTNKHVTYAPAAS